ncbi:MAG TPA: hypothetical protein VHF89_14360 [Solirubrobacteraceae bacterium]|nr:hypothetical protein [Solirubrobacteraceae bacterium]
MSEPHAEPPAADVRSFLPRPGEPVEDYAARLRALHHDLTLVLDAVERGLAAAEERAPLTEPLAVYAHEPRPVAEPRRSPPPPGPLSAPRGSARVEVVTTPATARDAEAEGGRPWSAPQVPEGEAPRGRRRAPMGEGAPAGGEPAAPSPERWPPREPQPHDPWDDRGAAAREPGHDPWDDRGAAAREPGHDPWVERPSRPPRAAPWQEPPPWTERRPSAWPPPPPPPAEMSFEPPPYAPFAMAPRRRRPSAPPVLVAATILGWLTVLALVLALALD